MKKFIFSLIIGFVSLMCFTSCASSVYAQTEVYDRHSDASVIIRYGTPYYYNGSILYYLYDGFYYYPYLRNNRYYYFKYTRPLPPPRRGRHFEPRYYDKRYVGNYRRNTQVRSSTFGNHYHPKGNSNFGGNHGNRHFGVKR